MKKLFALFLALALLLSCVSAVAEPLTSTFTADADTLSQTIAYAYSLQYPEGALVVAPQDDRILLTGDGMLPILLMQNEAGEVTLIASTYEGSLENPAAIGSSMGVTCTVMAHGAFLSENTLADFQSAVINFTSEMNQLLGCLLNLYDYTPLQLAKGISSTATLMTYPASIYYQSAIDGNGTLSIKLGFALAPQGTVLE